MGQGHLVVAPRALGIGPAMTQDGVHPTDRRVVTWADPTMPAVDAGYPAHGARSSASARSRPNGPPRSADLIVKGQHPLRARRDGKRALQTLAAGLAHRPAKHGVEEEGHDGLGES